MKRIILIFPHMVMYGGALNYTLAIAKELSQQGNDVAIATLAFEPANIDIPEGITVLNAQGPLTSSICYWLRFFSWQRKLSSLVTEWQPDIIIPQVFPANWWGWLFKKNNPATKLIWICHEPSAFIHSRKWIKALKPFWKSWLAQVLALPFSLIDRKLFKNSDAVLANSKFTAVNCKKIYGREVDAIAYPAVDSSLFNYDEKIQRKKQIITVCHLSRFKNVDFLLRIFASASERLPNYTYVIVGKGEDKDYLKNLANELGLNKLVSWVESVDVNELSKLYSQSSLFLHGSVDEPFGMAPLEALACGTPIVAHNSGGPKEIVTKQECGILVNDLEIDSWCEAIVGLLETGQLFENRFILNAKHSQSFDWKETANKINSVM